MLELTAAELAVMESLLPKSTGQLQIGALSWIKTNNMMQMTSKEQGFNNEVNIALTCCHNLYLHFNYEVYLIYVQFF